MMARSPILMTKGAQTGLAGSIVLVTVFLTAAILFYRQILNSRTLVLEFSIFGNDVKYHEFKTAERSEGVLKFMVLHVTLFYMLNTEEWTSLVLKS